MEQRYFIDSWLLPYSLRSHRIANPTPKNRLRHFSVLPTHNPAGGGLHSGQWSRDLNVMQKLANLDTFHLNNKTYFCPCSVNLSINN